MRYASVIVGFLLASACSQGRTADANLDGTDAAADHVAADAPTAPVQLVFDVMADLTNPTHFYDMPYPADVRLAADTTPDLRGFRGANASPLVPQLLGIAQQRHKYPTLSVAYFQFTGPLAPQDPTRVVAAASTSPTLLIDVDPTSSERGRLIPTVAWTPPMDAYLPANTLTLAARPGFVLHAGRTYAFVVLRSLGDAWGRPLAKPVTFDQVIQGTSPGGPTGPALVTATRPLLDTLAMLHVDASRVAAATVFSTGDVVAESAALGDQILAAYSVTIDNLTLAAGDDLTSHPRFCQLVGTMTLPQFQGGTPPFDTDGQFHFGADGLPIPQTYSTLPTYATVPVSITLPRALMPTTGYPLVVYFHGSGGVSSAVVDRGIWQPQSPTFPCPNGTDTWNGVAGCNTLGQGPAYVHAVHGFAAAGSALPLNPERLPGASDTAYLNLGNLAAFRDTFRQGMLEQRLFIRALSNLHIPSTLVAQCTNASLPAGASSANFDVGRLVAQGQSMGGMYTNLISATEPAIRAAIPTGAGGYWGYFILQTSLVPGAAATLGAVLRTATPLTFMHPTLALLETAWEPAEPIVYMPRLARDPLPSHPVRPIYEPVGQGDSYFPTVVYDAVALAYGHQEAGQAIWTTMQDALSLAGLNGILSYPVVGNRMAPNGTGYTGVVIQYAGDGVYDPHAIYSQLDAVKYQYACFAHSFVQTGIARVPDPTGMVPESPCP